MNNTKIVALLLAVFSFVLPQSLFAAEVSVNAEARVFKPDIVYIQPGDTVQWKNMTSHNSVTYVVPDGATGWGEHGQLPGGSFSATPDKEGIYGYACEPHVGFGMVGVVVVGNPTAEMKDAAMKKADADLQGPFRRLMGSIKKVEAK